MSGSRWAMMLGLQFGIVVYLFCLLRWTKRMAEGARSVTSDPEQIAGFKLAPKTYRLTLMLVCAAFALMDGWWVIEAIRG